MNSLKRQEIINLKNHLSKVSPTEIVEKIENFRKINLKKISDSDLRQEIIKTISIYTNDIGSATLRAFFLKYPPKTRFYRVRKIDSNDTKIPLKSMKIEGDAWNPPKEIVTTRGRLNDVNESLLYTTPNYPFVAVDELKIKSGEFFSLIVYEAKETIKTTVIGAWQENPELNEEENLKMRLINNFLSDEFSRDVGVGTDYLYRSSIMIAKFFFDLPPKVMQDAWAYPSVAFKKLYNVCFRPEIAKDLLKLVGVQISRANIIDERGYEFNCQVIASGFNEKKEFNYYHISHPIVKEIFPELIKN